MSGSTSTGSTWKSKVQRALNQRGYLLTKIEPRTPADLSHIPAGELGRLSQAIGALPLNERDWETFTSASVVQSYLNPERIGFYHELLATSVAQGVRLQGASVLDVGTCSGYLLHAAQDKYGAASIHGTDYYEECVRLATAFVPGAKVYQASIDDLKASTQTYDVIFCTEVLEHILDTETQIPAMMKLVNPGGALVVTVPNGRPDLTPAMSTQDGSSFVGHVNFWSPESWAFYVERIAAGARTATGLVGGHYVDDGLYAIFFKGE